MTIDCLNALAREREWQNLNVQAFVVDNASGDYPSIVDAIRRNGWLDWVTPILAERNGGFSYGNNLGIREAFRRGSPEFVYLLNPDTQVRRGAVGELLEFLINNPGVGIAGSSFETEDLKGWPFAFRFPSLLSEVERGLQLGLISQMLSRWTVPKVMSQVPQRIDWICGASMMIRSEVFLKVGCLDENFFLYYEETEFCRRAKRAGFATWYVPDSRVMHIIGKSTNLTDETRASRRLPGYWFESRKRYFAVSYGIGIAVLIDLAAISSSIAGFIRRKVQRRETTPYYVRDLIAHSVLFRRNRTIAPLKTFFPST